MSAGMGRRLGWLAALSLWIALAGWMVAQPPGLGNDDALYFSHGLIRFSVLEFSPHFPGYPGLMLLGRLLLPLTGGDAQQALSWMCLAAALAIPWMTAWAASGEWRLAAFLLGLTQPLLPALGLSLLSDGPGALFLLLFFPLYLRGAMGRAGLALALAACCRPSLAVLILAALAAGWWRGRGQGRGRLVWCFALPCLLAFGWVLAWEGWSYVDEGLRFVQGHTGQWGHTALGTGDGGGLRGWGGLLWSYPALWVVVAAPIWAVWRLGWDHPVALTVSAGLVWTGVMQNPDNPRHLAPMLVLGAMAAVLPGVGRGRFILVPVVLAAQSWLLVQTVDWRLRPPPLSQAVDWLAAQPAGLVVTNHGVAVMRERLVHHRIADAHYGAQASFAAATARSTVWRVMGREQPGAQAAFPPRFLGEQGLWIMGLD